MREQLTIRKAALDDFHEIILMMQGLNQHEKTFETNRLGDRQAAVACIEDLKQDVEECDGCFFVAQLGEAIVGFLAATVQHEDAYYVEASDVSYGLISDMFVKEAFRGQGIGSALLGKAEAYFAERGLTRIQLVALAANKGALDLYERHAFRPYETVMVKRIAETPSR